MLIPKFDERFLQAERRKNKKSLYYFAKGTLGFDGFTPEFHLPLCNKLQGLEGAWKRALICGFRGCYKTSVTKAFAWWVLIHYKNSSILMVEQRYDNAEDHHVEMQQLLRQNGLFLEMYKDRIPSGFEGWTKSETVFTRDDPIAPVSLRIAGLNTRLEGIHVDMVWCNDLEGADVGKSDIPRGEAERFVFNRAVPLLKSPRRSRILVEGTPHGEDPLVWKVRDLEETTDWKGCKRWKTWWMPVHDENRKPTFPDLFGEEEIADLYKQAERSNEARKLLDQQYLLRRTTQAGGGFDMGLITSQLWHYELGLRAVRYPAWEEDRSDYDPVTLRPKLRRKEKYCDLRDMKFYVHGDPKHRAKKDLKHPTTSQWAVVVVGITPDYHALVMETSCSGEGGLPKFMDEYVRLYCKWRAREAPTLEQVGAQVWALDYLRALEKTKYIQYVGPPVAWDPTPRALPRLSSRLVEAHKGGQSKEFHIMEQLDLWHAQGWLHLHEKQTELIEQHRVFPSLVAPLDLIDALAQGPAVWKPPMSQEARAAIAQRQAILDTMRAGEPVTGYRRPWVEDSPLPVN